MEMKLEVENRSSGTSSAKLREQSQRFLETERKKVIEATRIDPEKVWAQTDEPNFSFRKLRESLRTKFKEAVAETNFGFLVRYGVNKQINEAYNLHTTIYEDLADIVTSKTIEEWYGLVYRPGLPQDVQPGEDFPEVKVAGREAKIQNKKVGGILNIEKELFDDDQVGRIKMLANQPGDGMKIKEEIDVLVKFMAYQSGGDANAQYASGGYQITLANFEKVWASLRKAKDPKGDLVLVQPNAVVVDTDDEIAATKMLLNATTVAVPGSSDVTGYFNTMNVLKGKFTIHASPYVTQAPNIRAGINGSYNPWAVMEKKKGLVFQSRTPLQVVQESPNSGDAFIKDSIRFRFDRRYGTDVVDGLFIYYGN